MLVVTQNVELIHSLDKQCFDDSSYSFDLLVQMQPNHIYYLIQNDQKVNVGFIILLASGNDYELIKIGVLSSYRHQSFAYQSLKKLLDELQFDNFFLEVKSSNTNAINLYKKLNFKIIGIRKKYYQDLSDCYVMQYSKLI